MSKESPPVSVLRGLFFYDGCAGQLHWRPRNRNLTGRIAGGVDPGHGYRRVRIGGKFELVHRVVLAMHLGRWPTGEVDHINGIRDDNRIENLREVTRSENLRNKAIYRSNKSGRVGVHWHKQHRKWCATIGINGRSKTLGVFSDLSDAILAREAAERAAGFHENHGR
jgi:hypothetical protein